MEKIKCITFDKEAQDALPQEIRDRMNADRNRAMSLTTSLLKVEKERVSQVSKHGFTPEFDYLNNNHYQLTEAAAYLIYPDIDDYEAEEIMPQGWKIERWKKMYDKPYEQRLIIAAALIIAELDRIGFNQTSSV